MSKELADKLKVIVEMAPKLRAAGIPYVKADGVEFTVGADPTEEPKQKATVDDDGGDPFEKPELYGLPPGSKVPRLNRSKQ